MSLIHLDTYAIGICRDFCSLNGIINKNVKSLSISPDFAMGASFGLFLS